MNAEQFHKEMIAAAEELAATFVAANAKYADRVDAANEQSPDIPDAMKAASIIETAKIVQKAVEDSE